MCQPRRIIVKVGQKLNEMWQKELDHYERMTDEIRVSDSISAEIEVDQELGELAYPALLESLAEGFRGWQSEGGVYRKEIDGVTATFDPATRKISICAEMNDVITAAIQKKTTVGEQFTKELSINLNLGGTTWGSEDKIELAERKLRDKLEADLEKGKRQHTNSCLVTMVAVDRRGRPSKVPGLLLETREEKQRFADGLRRRKARSTPAGACLPAGRERPRRPREMRWRRRNRRRRRSPARKS